MKSMSHVLKNQRGLSLIPVLIVSMILVSLLSVWMIQFSNKSASGTQDWVQKENFRIGTELGKQVAAGYELFVQQGSHCNSGQSLVNGKFCFLNPNDSVTTSACASSTIAPTPVCLRTAQNDQWKQKFPEPDDAKSMTTFYASYGRPSKLNLFMSTASAAQGAPAVPSYSGNTATALTTCTAAGAPYSICHACTVSGPTNTCFQVIYCSVADPNCTTPIKLGLMVKTS